jgi:predicted ATPase
MLKRIKITNLLSFGDPGLDLELRPLNVLIGPNGSGKSNLLSVIQLLKSMQTDLFAAMRSSAAIGDWLWRGASGYSAEVEVLVDGFASPLRHRVTLGLADLNHRVISEEIDVRAEPAPISVLRSKHGRVSDWTHLGGAHLNQSRGLAALAQELDVSNSAVAQLASVGTAVWELATDYRKIATYLSWQFGPRTGIRLPQPTDGASDVLSDDFSNLALVLSRIDKSASAKATLLAYVKQIFEGVNDYRVIVEGGYAQVFLSESVFDRSIPASRLSDGTLRYLALLAILCDPKPMASTICIDEPELGLHPDLLPGLAKLMIEASERMQLIVTTHSDIIIDALSEVPESVVVCERHDGQTTMRRLVASELAGWLQDYRLGQLWTKGSIGGNRW